MGSAAMKMRESIIDGAQDIFAKFGFKKTTMDEIAREVHKEKSSIYHYFKGKEEIFVEVVNKEIRTLQNELALAVNQQKTPQAKLRAFIVTRIRCLGNLPNLTAVLKEDSRIYLASAASLRETYRSSEAKMVNDILTLGVEKGVFRGKAKIDIILTGVMTAFNGIESLWGPDKPDDEFEQEVDSVMELVFHGIMENDR